MQTEKSGTIGVSQDQTLFAFGISPFESKGMLSDNPKVGFYETETTRTLDNNGGSPACQQGGTAIVQKSLNPWDVQSKHIAALEGIAEALYSGECRWGGGESYVMAVDVRNGVEGCVNGTLQAKSNGGYNTNSNNIVIDKR